MNICIPLGRARQELTNLVRDAQYGYSITVTVHSEPAAELVACYSRPRGRSTMVGMRELKVHFSQYVKQAQEKSDMYVSRRGVVVEKLTGAWYETNDARRLSSKTILAPYSERPRRVTMSR